MQGERQGRHAAGEAEEPGASQRRLAGGDLARLGVVAAYRMVKMRQGKASLNLLFALQATLDRVPWDDLPARTKERLRREAEEVGE